MYVRHESQAGAWAPVRTARREQPPWIEKRRFTHLGPLYAKWAAPSSSGRHRHLTDSTKRRVGLRHFRIFCWCSVPRHQERMDPPTSIGRNAAVQDVSFTLLALETEAGGSKSARIRRGNGSLSMEAQRVYLMDKCNANDYSKRLSLLRRTGTQWRLRT